MLTMEIESALSTMKATSGVDVVSLEEEETALFNTACIWNIRKIQMQ
jgi:hypothetical protein